jgi:HSP20 family molecular chaperone IbpA
MERRYGSFEASLRISDTADEKRIEARFENGRLESDSPKHPEAAGEQRKIG